MKIAGGVGSVGSIPAKGVVVNIENGDVSAGLEIAKGIGKGLLGLGALALLFSSSSNDNEDEDDIERRPLSALSMVKVGENKFVGKPLDDSLEFECEDECYTISFDSIVRIIRNEDLLFDITLADGTVHNNAIILTKALTFATTSGNRTIQFPKVTAKSVTLEKTFWQRFTLPILSILIPALPFVLISWDPPGGGRTAGLFLASVFGFLGFLLWFIFIHTFETDWVTIVVSPDYKPPTRREVLSQEFIWNSTADIRIFGPSKDDLN